MHVIMYVYYLYIQITMVQERNITVLVRTI